MAYSVDNSRNVAADSLSDFFGGWASNMGAQQRAGVNQAQQAKLEAETLAEQANSRAMAGYRDNLRSSLNQPSSREVAGPTQDGSPLMVQTPLTKEQEWENQDIHRRMAVKNVAADPYTRDTFGRTYDRTTGRPVMGGPERMGAIESIGDDRIKAATYKDNSAGDNSSASARKSRLEADNLRARQSMMEQIISGGQAPSERTEYVTAEPDTLSAAVDNYTGPSLQEFISTGGTEEQYNALTGRKGDSWVEQRIADYHSDPLIKTFQGGNTARNKIRAMYASGNEQESNLADQTMLTLYAKIMDEDSAVRGEEVNALINSGGFSAFLKNWDSYFREDGRLLPDQRESFLKNAELLVEAARKDALKVKKRYQDRAKKGKRYGDVTGYVDIPDNPSEFLLAQQAEAEAEKANAQKQQATQQAKKAQTVIDSKSIKGFDPELIEATAQQLIRVAPELADDPVALRAAIRARLTGTE